MKDVSAIRLPTVFRRRLTIAFVVVAGAAAGILTIGTFLVVSDQRNETFVNRSVEQTRTLLALSRGEASATRLDELVTVARERNGLATLVEADGVVSSRPELTLDAIPDELRNAREGELKTAGTELSSEPFLVVGSIVPGSGERAHIYILFSQSELRSSLGELRTVLFAGWLAVTIMAALVGSVIARRTLAPIQQAATAARALTEGLLDTRLPQAKADEFGEWARYFNEMAAALEHKIDQLEAAHARERRFTADVAHDLRTPLGAMVNSASLLRDGLDELPASSRRPVELLIGDIDRLRHLVSDLLELGQLDAQEQLYRLESVDLRELVDGVIRSAARDQDVVIDVPSERVITDRSRVERVVSNLVNNALVHGDNGVEVRAVVVSSNLVIKVCDRGKGIPTEQLPHVFDRFYKTSASRSTEGSGLGLAIAAEHARVLGGSITAQNRTNGGAMFSFAVPVEIDPGADEVDAVSG